MNPHGREDLDRAAYAFICSHDGVTAREISHALGVDRSEINRCLYRYPFISDLCYHDDEYRWHGLISQSFPHEGLHDYCGWYGYVYEFLGQNEQTWLAELQEGCRRIGRNLNDTRGLMHSFADAREAMRGLFGDLDEFGVDSASWEIAFELRIRRAKWVRIYADVLVITPTCAFSLEFKMKDSIDPSEVEQAAKYAPYLEIVLGEKVAVIPALVLTRAEGLFAHENTASGKRVAIASADMLFNVFDERFGFLA